VRKRSSGKKGESRLKRPPVENPVKKRRLAHTTRREDPGKEDLKEKVRRSEAARMRGARLSRKNYDEHGEGKGNLGKGPKAIPRLASSTAPPTRDKKRKIKGRGGGGCFLVGSPQPEEGIKNGTTLARTFVVFLFGSFARNLCKRKENTYPLSGVTLGQVSQ